MVSIAVASLKNTLLFERKDVGTKSQPLLEIADMPRRLAKNEVRRDLVVNTVDPRSILRQSAWRLGMACGTIEQY